LFIKLRASVKRAYLFLCLIVFLSMVLGALAASSPLPLSSPFDELAREAITLYGTSYRKTETILSGTDDSHFLGGISPHHGLAFPMIVGFYETLRRGSLEDGAGIKRVFILSPDHFRQVRGHSALCPEDWKLSKRELKADLDAMKDLSSLSLVEEIPGICSSEHGITLHIPMIAEYFPNAKVVPLILNPTISDTALLSIRKKMSALFTEDSLLILSMDLSHYKTPELMAQEDEKTLPILTDLRAYATKNLDMDARRAAHLTLLLFKDKGATEGIVIEHHDSSFFAGYRVESGTSYATIVYPTGK
jgi:AmmeMemoRadiSam system protein B